jgi:hypothetical protein
MNEERYNTTVLYARGPECCLSPVGCSETDCFVDWFHHCCWALGDELLGTVIIHSSGLGVHRCRQMQMQMYSGVEYSNNLPTECGRE